MARTDTLPHFLTDVADAIRTKTGSSDTITASNFDTAIGNIPSGGGADLSEYFEEYTVNGTSNYSGFSRSIKKMPPIKLSGTITRIDYMFKYYKGTSLDLSQINNNKIKNMEQAFYNCSNLTSLDLTCFTGTASLTNTSNMFYSCTSLMHIDMRTFDFSNVTSYQNMFGGGISSNQVPSNCEIIVADATQKNWILDKFSRLTNVKTVEEYENE